MPQLPVFIRLWPLHADRVPVLPLAAVMLPCQVHVQMLLVARTYMLLVARMKLCLHDGLKPPLAARKELFCGVNTRHIGVAQQSCHLSTTHISPHETQQQHKCVAALPMCNSQARTIQTNRCCAGAQCGSRCSQPYGTKYQGQNHESAVPKPGAFQNRQHRPHGGATSKPADRAVRERVCVCVCLCSVQCAVC